MHRSIRHFTDEPVTDAQRGAVCPPHSGVSSVFTVRLWYPYYRRALRGVSADGRAKARNGAGRWFWVFCADFNRHLQT